MNANAYGGALGEVLDWVDVCTAAGVERREPGRPRLRVPELEHRRARGRLARLVRAGARAERRGQGDDGRHAPAPPRGAALGDQDVRLDLRQPDDPRAEGRSAGQLLDAAGARGLERGGARLSPKHANFVENFEGEATTADVLAVMAAARRVVHERFGVVLEPEVQVLGEVEWPADWSLES